MDLGLLFRLVVSNKALGIMYDSSNFLPKKLLLIASLHSRLASSIDVNKGNWMEIFSHASRDISDAG